MSDQEKNEQAARAKEAPSKEELTDLIDREVEFYFQRAQRPGWSKWALFAAFGGLCWLALDEFSTGYKIPISILLILAILLIQDIGEYLVRFITGSQKLSSPMPNRYVYFSDYMDRLDNSLLLIPFLVIKYSGMLILGVIFGPEQWFPYKVVFVTFIGSLLFLLAVAIPFVLFRIPASLSDKEKGWIDYASIIYFIGLGGVAAYGYLCHAIENYQIDVHHVKFSLLASGCVIIFSYIAKEPALPSAISGLMQMRRDLVLGRTSAKIVASEITVIFAGLTASDVLAEDVNALEENLNSINNQFDNFDSIGKEVLSKVSDLKGRMPTERDLEEIVGMLESWQSAMGRAADQFPRGLMGAIKKCKFKKFFLRHKNGSVDVESDSVWRKIVEKVNATSDRYANAVEVYNEGVKSVREVFDRAESKKSNEAKRR